MHKTTKKPELEDHAVEGGIGWVGAGRPARNQDELRRLRAHVEATRLW